MRNATEWKLCVCAWLVNISRRQAVPPTDQYQFKCMKKTVLTRPSSDLKKQKQTQASSLWNWIRGACIELPYGSCSCSLRAFVWWTWTRKTTCGASRLILFSVVSVSFTYVKRVGISPHYSSTPSKQMFGGIHCPQTHRLSCIQHKHKTRYAKLFNRKLRAK